MIALRRGGVSLLTYEGQLSEFHLDAEGDQLSNPVHSDRSCTAGNRCGGRFPASPAPDVNRPGSPEAGKRNLPPSCPKLFGALLLLMAAVWFLLHTLGPDIPKLNPKPFTSLGEFAADELVKGVASGGKVQIVMAVPGREVPAASPLARFLSALVPEVAAFRARLSQNGRFTFAPEVRLPQPARAQATVWPSGALTSLLTETQDQTVIVVFGSLPGSLNSTEREQLRRRAGKLMLVGVLDAEARALVDAKLAGLAIAARVPVPAVEGSGKETPEQWVRRVYAVVTP